MSPSKFMMRTIAALVCLFLLKAEGPAPRPAGAAGSTGEHRIALVVGNSAYRNTTPLANPRNDAADIAAALERTGFEVIVALDAGKAQMDGALRAFANKLSRADVALFFYAGHGLQVGSQNYLVPVEARLASERDLEFEATKLDFVLRQMEIDRDGKTTIVILDACRDNPLTRSLARSMGTRSVAIGRGLAPEAAGVGTFIAYSTQPGNVALDGKGRNSPFTSALLQSIPARGRNLNATMIEVRKAVIRATGGKQVPWDHSALTGDFFFVPGEARTGSTVAAPAARSDDVAALKARLKALEERERQRGAATTKAGQAAKASPQGPRTEPATIDVAPSRIERGFGIYGEARIAGDAIKISAADSVAGCITVCRNTTGCVAGAFSASEPARSACTVYRQVHRLQAGIAGATAFAQAPSPASVPPVLRTVRPGSDVTFQRSDNVRIEGAPLGTSFRAPNPDACREACGREAACVAYQHGRKIPVMGQCQLFTSISSRHEDRAWRSGVRTGQ